MQEALIVEADAGGDLRLRHAMRQELLRERDAAMGDVRVRREADLFAKRPAKAELVEAGVRGESFEVDRFGEAGVEHGPRARHGRAQCRTTTGLRAGRRTYEVDQGMKRASSSGTSTSGFSVSFSVGLDLKLRTRRASIVIAIPVWGLRPGRSCLSRRATCRNR
jgi:hypothetical protein